MSTAWEIYFAEFQRRAARVPGQKFGREEAFAEAAHDAYVYTADRLTAEGWDDDRTLHLVRGLNQAAGEWIERDGASWEALRERLAAMAAQAEGSSDRH